MSCFKLLTSAAMVLSASLFLSTTAQATEGFGILAEAGLSMHCDHMKNGFDIGASAEYTINYFQAGAEYLFLSNKAAKDFGTGTYHSHAFMANAGLVYPTGPVHLGVAAGLGMLRTSFASTSTNTFAMQAIVSAEYMVNEIVGVGAHYHYITAKKGGERINYNLINASVSYSFSA